MQGVTVESHYASPIVLDQCPSCGGVWFDSLELFRTKPGQAEKMQQLDQEQLRQPAQAKNNLACPRDGAVLVAFQDMNFPASIHVEHCQTCFGFWFNYGEFRAFEEAQKSLTKKRAAAQLDPRLEEQIDKLFKLYSTEGRSSTLGKIGAFLSTPVTHSGFVLTKQDDWRSGPASTTANIALQALMALLRAMIGR